MTSKTRLSWVSELTQRKSALFSSLLPNPIPRNCKYLLFRRPFCPPRVLYQSIAVCGLWSFRWLYRACCIMRLVLGAITPLSCAKTDNQVSCELPERFLWLYPGWVLLANLSMITATIKKKRRRNTPCAVGQQEAFHWSADGRRRFCFHQLC